MASRLRESLEPRISFFAFQDIITSTSGILIIVVLLLGTFLGTQSDDDPRRRHRHQKDLEEKKAALEQEVARLTGALGELQDKAAQIDPEKVEREAAVLRSLNQGLVEKIAALAADGREKKKAIEAVVRRSGLDKLEAEVRELEQKNTQRRASLEELRQEHDTLAVQVQKLSAKVTLAETEKNKIWLIPDDQPSTKAPLILFLSPGDCRIWEFDRPEKQHNLPTAPGDFQTRLQQILKSYRTTDHYVVLYVQPGAVSLHKKALELIRDDLRFDAGWDAVEAGVTIQSGAPPSYQLEEPEVISSLPPGKP